MIEWRKHLFKFCLISISLSIIVLISAVTMTSWVVIKVQDEVNIPKNITQKFPNFKVNKLDLEITYSFGLTTFCVATHDIQLQTQKKECHNIAIFRRDLEQAALQDAMKFEILSIAFLSLSLIDLILVAKVVYGHLKNVMSYVAMAFISFSGISSMSSLIMVAGTLTEDSSIVKYNILSHRGEASEIDLQGIVFGDSYKVAVAGVLLIFGTLLLFIAHNRQQRGDDMIEDGQANYRLLTVSSNDD